MGEEDPPKSRGWKSSFFLSSQAGLLPLLYGSGDLLFISVVEVLLEINAATAQEEFFSML